MQSLHNILKKLTRDFGIEGGALLNILRNKWISIVGQTIAVHTFPDMLKGKILTIIVDTPQWMHHLSFYKEEISQKLKPYDIKGIRFRLGKLPQSISNKKIYWSEESILSDRDLRYIENTVKSIKDEKLKEKFKKLITHGLKKSKKRGLKSS